MAPLTSVFPIILTALTVSLLASWPAAWLAKRLNLVDIPGLKAHKRHLSATPMGGGLALAAGLAAGVVWIQWNANDQMVGIALGALVVLLFGLLDDRFDLSVPLKLLGQLAAAVS
jgi:UDP-GlcNAc:undecaprenyl-phosphate GlcNAc-1-phosphate transferase